MDRPTREIPPDVLQLSYFWLCPLYKEKTMDKQHKISDLFMKRVKSILQIDPRLCPEPFQTAVVYLGAIFTAEQFSTNCNFRSCVFFFLVWQSQQETINIFSICAFVMQRKQVQSHWNSKLLLPLIKQCCGFKPNPSSLTCVLKVESAWINIWHYFHPDSRRDQRHQVSSFTLLLLYNLLPWNSFIVTS